MDDNWRGKGPSTASQTGWALMALVAVGGDNYEAAIRRGLDYLLAHQKSGSWDEPQYTGTGFPGYGVGERTNLKEAGATLDQGCELARGFMINYNMYRHYFPLIAMARARRHLGLAAHSHWQDIREEVFALSESLPGRACG
jgi:squalene-hopene/tetraprenyl-beta-curcumene cyclase